MAHKMGELPGSSRAIPARSNGQSGKISLLTAADVGAADTVIGSLPVNLAAAVCKRGARYLHLLLEVPEAWRRRELTANELLVIAARLDAYHVERVENNSGLPP